MSSKIILRWAWIILAVIIFIVSIIILFGYPTEKMHDWISVLPWLSGLTVVLGGAAFGGSSLKRITQAMANGKYNGVVESQE